jgi:hypothetical protein
MTPAMADDIRAYARAELPSPGQPMPRERYIAAVRAYAVEKHAGGQDVAMFAERTARYLWARRSLADAYDELGAAKLLDKPEPFGSG